MKKIEIDIMKPCVCLDGRIIAPLSIEEFRGVADSFANKMTNLPREFWTDGYVISSVEFMGRRFELNVWFDGDRPAMVSLNWLEGRAVEKGWGADEEDIVADKNNLARALAKKIGMAPDEHDQSISTFNFSWGIIRAVAVRMAQYAKIDIEFAKNNIEKYG